METQKIKSIRRSELIQATIGAIYKHGFADLTVGHIADYADVSTGNIHYYFGGKDALLESTMRHLLSLLSNAHRRRSSGLSDPVDRIHAVVQANFDETFLTREICLVWTQFWAFAPYKPKLAQLQKINKSRVKSNIVSPLRGLNPAQGVDATANAIQAYMDGIWVQTAQTGFEPDLGVIQSKAKVFTDHILANS